MAAAKTVYKAFDREFKEGELEEWSEEMSDEGNKILYANNRVFTPAKDSDKREVHIPFEKDTDPNGFLEKIARGGFKRTSDNVVEYAQARITLEGDKT